MKAYSQKIETKQVTAAIQALETLQTTEHIKFLGIYDWAKIQQCVLNLKLVHQSLNEKQLKNESKIIRPTNKSYS